MSLLEVTHQELVSANLLHLLQPGTHHDVILEIYIWHVTEPQALICMLAGIGRILDNSVVDTAPI